MDSKDETVLTKDQLGFRIVEVILVLRMIVERKREINKKIYVVFIEIGKRL